MVTVFQFWKIWDKNEGYLSRSSTCVYFEEIPLLFLFRVAVLREVEENINTYISKGLKPADNKI
jgi:hypothetical protein